jgi:hypothetical protein
MIVFSGFVRVSQAETIAVPAGKFGVDDTVSLIVVCMDAGHINETCP